MSTAEPKGLGAVVLARFSTLPQPRVWVKAHDGGWWDDCNVEAAWDELVDPVVVSEGYVPPTPEPTKWAAVVRDGNGLRVVRLGWDAACPWATKLDAYWHWSELAQPVEILFDGVDDE